LRPVRTRSPAISFAPLLRLWLALTLSSETSAEPWTLSPTSPLLSNAERVMEIVPDGTSEEAMLVTVPPMPLPVALTSETIVGTTLVPRVFVVNPMPLASKVDLVTLTATEPARSAPVRTLREMASPVRDTVPPVTTRPELVLSLKSSPRPTGTVLSRMTDAPFSRAPSTWLKRATTSWTAVEPPATPPTSPDPPLPVPAVSPKVHFR